jgi:hypothetical protein
VANRRSSGGRKATAWNSGGNTTMGDKPICKLVGTDGNVFAIIGTVSRTLKNAEMPNEAKEFTSKAFASGSYDEVLRLCMDYVEVE